MPIRTRESRRIAACILAMGVGVALAGCARDRIRQAAGPYQGPPITIDSSGAQHVIVLEPPTGGWRFTFDQVHPAFERRNVYVTAMRPDPAMMHTQAVVTHRLGTSVNAQTPISVHARVVEFTREPGAIGSAPYHLAATSDPAPPGRR